MNTNCAVILAAGEGTRMKSAKPKVLSEVLFKPMLDRIIDSVKSAGVEDICVVTGFQHELVEEHLDSSITTVFQAEALGTGHAVIQARDFIKSHTNANVLVINGDVALMDSETLNNALTFHTINRNTATVISAKVSDPAGYGRIVRNSRKELQCIVEEKQATDVQKIIREVNSGAYWFNCSVLLDALDSLTNKHKNPNKEYYFTDLIEIIVKKNLKADAYKAEDSNVILGVNTRIQLNEVTEILRKKILNKLMFNGVSIPCTDGIMISDDTIIGTDTLILPGTIIKNQSVIGSNCVIGPNSVVADSVIGDNVQFNSSQIESSRVGSDTKIGPFARIRPNCDIGKDILIGDFVELKNSQIGDSTKISHLTYIGDSTFGKNINVGCGCATVNFSGKIKSQTIVGDNAFIGCSTYMVAPVTIGENAYTAAGSVITEDVPDNALAIARSRQTVKKDWVNRTKPYRWQK